MVRRRRLDDELVRRGLSPSRSQARAIVREGRVTVDGAPAAKPGRLVSPAEAVLVSGPPARFVSRGGDKLAAALGAWGIDPTGWRVLDAGASTGGFTDCLLQHGAGSVVALDVGHGQLHPKIRDDPRVEVVERTNLRAIDPADLGTFDLVTCDLSFISLTTVAASLAGLLRDDGQLVALVKPQFEAGRVEVSRGRGVVTDPAVWRAALERVIAALEDQGTSIMEVMASPIKGGSGNVEFLLHAVPSRAERPARPLDLASVIDDATSR
jgi:23S rRNA (cytidine1920-2'-O)/16S rRNA (cytidine1409-2'-O)-methyltransferase